MSTDVKQIMKNLVNDSNRFDQEEDVVYNQLGYNLDIAKNRIHQLQDLFTSMSHPVTGGDPDDWEMMEDTIQELGILMRKIERSED